MNAECKQPAFRFSGSKKHGYMVYRKMKWGWNYLDNVWFSYAARGWVHYFCRNGRKFITRRAAAIHLIKSK